MSKGGFLAEIAADAAKILMESQLAGACSSRQKDSIEFALTVPSRYMTLESVAPLSDDPTVSLPILAS